MKNLFVLLSFLIGVGFLIAWLWSDTSESKTLKQIVSKEAVEKDVKKNNQKKLTVKSTRKLNEVEISDDNGLVIKILHGQEINQRVTKNPVKDLQVYDGVLTFSEKENNHWSFKAVNLEQYIQKYLKK